MTKTKANMCFSKSNFTLFYLAFSLFFSSTQTATFAVVNQCSYTVWAAATPGGGQRLNSGQSWTIDVPPNATHGRIWGRTNCSFDSKGRGICLTGDCKGLLECKDNGEPPYTLAAFSLNQGHNLDYLDISLVDGFNIPMEFSPTNNECDVIQCTGLINERCPEKLRAPGGCLNPCQVFKNTSCCGGSDRGNCGSDWHSFIFRQICPNATIYPTDDGRGLFNCPGGTNYRVVFCPSKSTQDDDYTALFNTCADIPYYGVVDDTYYGVVICPS